MAKVTKTLVTNYTYTPEAYSTHYRKWLDLDSDASGFFYDNVVGNQNAVLLVILDGKNYKNITTEDGYFFGDWEGVAPEKHPVFTNYPFAFAAADDLMIFNKDAGEHTVTVIAEVTVTLNYLTITALKAFTAYDQYGNIYSVGCGLSADVEETLGYQLIDEGLAVEGIEIIPTGTIRITSNGTVNVREYNSAHVNVSPITGTLNVKNNTPRTLSIWTPKTTVSGENYGLAWASTDLPPSIVTHVRIPSFVLPTDQNVVFIAGTTSSLLNFTNATLIGRVENKYYIQVTDQSIAVEISEAS